MKSFSIDIEALESVACTAQMAKIEAKVTVTEPAAPAGEFSVLHMSETTMRQLHQGLSKILKALDENAALHVKAYPLPVAHKPRRT